VCSSDLSGIGAACNLDTDCNITLTAVDRQAGVKAYCKKNAIDLAAPNATGVAFPGGFCTKRCGFEANSCGTGSQCLFQLGFIGHYENMCHKTCAAPSDCREGYGCVGLSSTIRLCLPLLADGGTPEVQDAGPGFAGAAGAACGDDMACQPPSTGTCLKATLSDGGMSGYTDGQCSAECGAVAALTIGDTWCGTNGSCNPYAYNIGDGLGPLVLWQCDQTCAFPDGGMASACRNGYVCDTSANGYDNCVPNCNNVPGFCGTGTCNATSGLCQ
jgi:hypothetical protein